ncbi:hypothetical protein GCM10025779_09160 [Arthrobacter cryoconiti]
MTFHILAIAADIANLILTICDTLTLRRSLTDALNYLQNCVFQPAKSELSFDMRMNVNETMASMVTIFAYQLSSAPSDNTAYLVAALLLFRT